MSRRSEEGVITVMSDSDDDVLTDYFKTARRRSLSPDLLTNYFGNRDWLSSKKQRVTSPAVPNVSSGSGPVVPAVPNVHSGSGQGLPVVPKVPSGSGTALPVVPKVPSGSGPGLPVVPKVPSGSGTVLPVSSGAMPKAPSGRISAVPKVLSGSSQPQGMRWGYNMRSCGRAAQQARPSAAPSDTAPSSASPPPAQPPSTAPPMPPSVLPAGPLELPPKEHRDTDEENSSEEDNDYAYDVKIPKHWAVVPHIIHRRLAKARDNEIGVDWCMSISYKEWPQKVRDLCIYRIDTYRNELGLTRFKVGITHCPTRRFIDAGYAYVKESPSWGIMQVLWVSEMVDFASELEQDLISHYKQQGTPGLWNIKGGGDSAPKHGPCFVYCVFGFGPRGGSFRVRKLAAKRREKLQQREAARGYPIAALR